MEHNNAPRQPNTIPKIEMAGFELGVPASEGDGLLMGRHASINAIIILSKTFYLILSGNLPVPQSSNMFETGLVA